MLTHQNSTQMPVGLFDLKISTASVIYRAQTPTHVFSWCLDLKLWQQGKHPRRRVVKFPQSGTIIFLRLLRRHSMCNDGKVRNRWRLSLVYLGSRMLDWPRRREECLDGTLFVVEKYDEYLNRLIKTEECYHVHHIRKDLNWQTPTSELVGNTDTCGYN